MRAAAHVLVCSTCEALLFAAVLGHGTVHGAFRVCSDAAKAALAHGVVVQDGWLLVAPWRLALWRCVAGSPGGPVVLSQCGGALAVVFLGCLHELQLSQQ